MKYSTVLLLSAIILSCSNDDNTFGSFELPAQMEISEEWDDLIIGGWKYVNQCEFGIVYGGCTESPFITQYTFKTESIVLFDGFNTDCTEGRYKIKGNTLELGFDCIDFQSTPGIYSLSNEFLILSYSGDDSAVYRVYERL